MGSHAEVFVFDHALFVGDLVPALHHLLLTGEMTPRLQQVAAKLAEGGGRGTYDPIPSYGGADLVRDCTYLRVPDLAYRAEGDESAFDGWASRACRSPDCASRRRCPLHRDATANFAEDFVLFATTAVEVWCLGESQFVGRNMNTACYEPTLEARARDHGRHTRRHRATRSRT